MVDLCMATETIPCIVWAGMTGCSEALLKKIPPFYAHVVCSFAYVNGLNLETDIQQNIWVTKQYLKLNRCMLNLDFVEVADLPTLAGVLDYKMVQMKAQHAGYEENLFLLCSALQCLYTNQLGGLKSTRTFPEYLEHTTKKLLQIQCQKIISLSNWYLVLQSQLAWDDCMKLFKHNLQKCRINKFQEVNFKIIHRILATLAVISKVRGSPVLATCGWCGEYANIDHILLTCPETIALVDKVHHTTGMELTLIDRVFGTLCSCALVMWLLNFAIYKTHLICCDGTNIDMVEVFKQTAQLYQTEFGCARMLIDF